MWERLQGVFTSQHIWNVANDKLVCGRQQVNLCKVVKPALFLDKVLFCAQVSSSKCSCLPYANEAASQSELACVP
ncbi:hypothetical protein GH733_003740 [Mirounga leonina]|nr:hypothetical protein GH733_003740 [Mirounga leonina]